MALVCDKAQSCRIISPYFHPDCAHSGCECGITKQTECSLCIAKCKRKKTTDEKMACIYQVCHTSAMNCDRPAKLMCRLCKKSSNYGVCEGLDCNNENRIIGGTNVEEFEYPWIVYLSKLKTIFNSPN